MIDLSTPNEWQHICPDTGLVMPWYTKPALDEIVTWDLKDKVVFEYGCGSSTLWWASKCKKLYGVEHDFEYFAVVASKIGDKAAIVNYQAARDYINCVKEWGGQFDIIIIDGSFRDACVPVALKYLKPGGKLIFDNWMQPSVEIQSQWIRSVVTSLPHKIYKQGNHRDWQTLIATKPKEITDIDITEVSLLSNGEYGIGYTTR